MRLYSSTTKNHNLLGISHKSREYPPNKYGKDERDYIRSMGNTKRVHCGDPQSSQHNQTRHALPSPPSPPPPGPPLLTSSHSSSEASSSESSTSFDRPPSCSTDDIFGETVELSSSQKETKESLKEQDSRGGALTCPDETSEWRSLNKAGIGDCLKSPKMGHWQHDEGLEL